MKRFGLLFLLLLLACQSRVDDPETRARALGQQLRCPVCRGVSIADSPSTLATEMMNVVREQIAMGKSDAEILNYFETRYGEWALLEPKAEGLNLSIWLIPLLFLIGGGLWIVRHSSKTKDSL